MWTANVQCGHAQQWHKATFTVVKMTTVTIMVTVRIILALAQSISHGLVHIIGCTLHMVVNLFHTSMRHIMNIYLCVNQTPRLAWLKPMVLSEENNIHHMFILFFLIKMIP